MSFRLLTSMFLAALTIDHYAIRGI